MGELAFSARFYSLTARVFLPGAHGLISLDVAAICLYEIGRYLSLAMSLYFRKNRVARERKQLKYFIDRKQDLS